MGYVFFIIVLFIILKLISFFGHNSAISKKVAQHGGSLIEFKRRRGVQQNCPFKWVSKNQSIYSFTYNHEGQVKEGWVKFGSLFGSDWKL